MENLLQPSIREIHLQRADVFNFFLPYSTFNTYVIGPIIIQLMQAATPNDYKKYGTPVLGPLIWLFSSVSVKNFTSLSCYIEKEKWKKYNHEQIAESNKGHSIREP